MAYEHFMVGQITAQHSNHANLAAEYADGFNDHQFRREFTPYNGVYVECNLVNFCRELRKVFRDAQFITSNSCKTRYLNGNSGFTEVHITMPNQPYSLGKLGYGNYSDTENAAPTYMVYSRKISNDKYRAHNDRYHSVMSKDLARAMVNVKKFVRQYTVLEMAPIELRKFVSDAKDAPEKVDDKWRNARSVVRDSDRMYRELKALHDQGHQFLSDEFAQHVRTWIEATKEWEAEKVRCVPATFVHVLPVRDQQYFDVVRAQNIRSKGSISEIKDDVLANQVHRFTQENIPRDLLGKLSVLSLVSDNQYIEGVGMRVHETLYWVEGI